MTKVCTKCKETFDVDFFNQDKSKVDGRYPSCKTCSRRTGRTEAHRAASRNWKLNNQDSTIAYEFNRYWSNVPAQRARALKSWLWRQYKITPEEYFYALNIQEHSCMICKVPDSQLSRRLAVDHAAEDGHVRGLLCNNCNVGLGNFKHSRHFLKRAIRYLEQT